MADAGLRLVVEGEKEFKKALADIDAQIKSNKKELQLLAEQYKVEDDGLGNLTERQKVLAESYAAQADKVALLKEKRAEAASSLGEEDRQTVALTNAVLDAETALARMAAQQEENNKMIEDAKYSVAEYDVTIEQMRATIDANASEIKGMGAEMDKLGDSADGLRGKNESLSKQNDVLRKSMDAQRSVIDSLNSEYKVAVQRYGEGSAEAEKYRKKVLDATAELGRMEDQLGANEQAIRDNSKALEDSADAPNGLLDALKDVSDQTGIEIPSGIDKIIGGLGSATSAAGLLATAAGAIGGKIAEVFKESVEYAEEVTKSAQELDLGVEEYQALQYVAGSCGVEMDAIADAIKEINNKAGESDKVLSQWVGRWEELQYATEAERKAVADAQAMWDDLGISIYNQNGTLKSSEQILYEAIDAFDDMGDGIERSKKMMDLFGESAKRLNPLVEMGADNMKAATEIAKEYSVAASENIATLERFGQAWKNFGNNVKMGLANAAGAILNGTAWGDFTAGLKEEWEAILDGSYFDKLKKTYFGYANGTYNHPGGLAIVGENGPEIVDLPRGSKVYPNGTAPDGMGGGVYIGSITIPASDIREFNDIIDIVQGAATGFRRG